MKGKEYILNVTDSGQRLDRFIAENLPELSRERAKALIQQGSVMLKNGTPLTQPSQKVQAGWQIIITLPEIVPAEALPENLPLDIYYEDDDLIVINKPAGISVHPATGRWSGTLVNALLHHCKGQLSGIGGVERPGIVHRLDKDTSGLMVIAKNDIAHQHLSKQFSDRTIERYYTALCYGMPKPLKGRIEGNIGRHPNNRKKMAVLENDGRFAATQYEVIESYHNQAALLRLKLETGRTHQIRVHMAHIRYGIMGDPVYGKPKKLTFGDNTCQAIRALTRQMLHAAVLGFVHPVSGEKLFFESGIPEDFQEVVDFLRAE